MEQGITWYEVLGVLPGAAADKIEREYDAKTALLRPDMIAGAPSNVLRALTERLATGNSAWGSRRIQGVLLKPGHRVSASTIRRVLKALKIPPAPERRTAATWRQFLHAQAVTMLAAGFSHVDCAVTCGACTVRPPRRGLR